MLVLSRKLGEKIVMTGDITVEVVEVRRDGTVRLGVTAPRTISVHREEVADRIERERATIAETPTERT